MPRAIGLIALAIAISLIACGETEVATTPTDSPTETATDDVAISDDSPVEELPARPATAPPTPTPKGELTREELRHIGANELGWIPILQYHHFEPQPSQFVRTPQQFKQDLLWLYEHDFYVIGLHDYLDGHFAVPAGKHPVILTFDDGAASQFRVWERDDGRLQIDDDCAIGIMERFFREHPDFGRGGHFALIPDRIFAWSNVRPADKHQYQYAEHKLEWLLKHGYEIGNHTRDHANLAELKPDEIKEQLAEANIQLAEFAPEAEIRVITLPYGGYPKHGDQSLLKRFTYKGKPWTFEGVLLVGANPAPSPYSSEFNPYAIPRIQAFDAELERWFTFMEENPGILFTSDGNPKTVTVPTKLRWGIADTLDLERLGDRELIRYDE